MHSLRESHMEAIDRILQYLKSSPEKVVLFAQHDHVNEEAYTNANCVGQITDRRSTSGYCTLMGGNLVI
jgi:hypothetical protein